VRIRQNKKVESRGFLTSHRVVLPERMGKTPIAGEEISFRHLFFLNHDPDDLKLYGRLGLMDAQR